MSERSRTYIARRRPIEMEAELVSEEQVVETWEGPRTAYPGDYIMTGVRGERWPVPGGEFDKLYDILGPVEDKENTFRVRKKAMEVAVFQTYEPITFRIRGEDFHADAGYFIISYGDEDSRYPCEPSVFFEAFEVIRPADEDEDFSV